MAIYTIDIYIPSDKTVSNIQFISDDETTVYQTIDNLTFESGKAYTLLMAIMTDEMKHANKYNFLIVTMPNNS